MSEPSLLRSLKTSPEIIRLSETLHVRLSVSLRQGQPGTICGALGRGAPTMAIGPREAVLDPSPLNIEAPFTYQRRGVETKIIVRDRLPLPDSTLLCAAYRSELVPFFGQVCSVSKVYRV